MRGGDDNGDDDFPNEISKGKIIHSGISPSTIEPAEYALEEGVPALMEESRPSPVADVTTRRGFMIATVATAFGAGLGAVVGSWIIADGQRETAGTTDKPLQPRPELREEQKLWIAGARALANATLSELVANYEPLLMVVELYGGDDVLWQGAKRLATYSLLKRDAEAIEIGRRLLQTFEFRSPPPEVQRLVPQLEELVHRRGR